MEASDELDNVSVSSHACISHDLLAILLASPAEGLVEFLPCGMCINYRLQKRVPLIAAPADYFALIVSLAECLP